MAGAGTEGGGLLGELGASYGDLVSVSSSDGKEHMNVTETKRRNEKAMRKR